MSQRTVTDGVSIAMLFVTTVPFPALPPADHTLLSVHPRSCSESSWHPEPGRAVMGTASPATNTQEYILIPSNSITTCPQPARKQPEQKNGTHHLGLSTDPAGVPAGSWAWGSPLCPHPLCQGGSGDQDQLRGVPYMCCMSHVLS